MRIKLRAKLSAGAPVKPPKPDYPLRVSSFFVSVGAHCLGAAALLLVTFPADPPAKPVYDELIKPHEHELVFYHFRPKTAPDVTPVKRIGNAPEPRGREVSKLAIIAASPKPESAKILISVPAPKIEIHEDMPAPLMVARLEAAPPPPPPPPPKPKTFVPPKPVQRDPKLPAQTPLLDAKTPALSSPAVSTSPPAPSLTFSKVTAPPTDIPVAPVPKPGNAKADIAVASLHPSDKLDSVVPNGERPGQFSKAPVQGAPSSGDTNSTGALTIPNLTIRQPKPEPVRATPVPTVDVVYAERVRSVPLSTLSVPLRPASRMIPRSVDARFQGRSVYTIVIPMEHIASYAGDWIMWFADRGSAPGETPLVRAPIPLRKREPVNQPALTDQERIQFAATLGKNGRLDAITLLTKAGPAVQRAVLEDVTSWEFQPATRDGKPVDVDVVLEIPFNLPVAIARTADSR